MIFDCVGTGIEQRGLVHRNDRRARCVQLVAELGQLPVELGNVGVLWQLATRDHLGHQNDDARIDGPCAFDDSLRALHNARHRMLLYRVIVSRMQEDDIG